MNARQATCYLQWCYEKIQAGKEEMTPEELELMHQARNMGLGLIKKFMRLGPEDWKYTPGEPFKW